MHSLNWPRKEEEHVVMMQAWKNTAHNERHRMANVTALRMMMKDRADPFIYRRVLIRLHNNVCYPAEFE